MSRLVTLADLVEVLEALISQSDGDTKDWIGGVLIKTRFTVSSEQSQSPAPRQRERDSISQFLGLVQNLCCMFILVTMEVESPGHLLKPKSWEKGLTSS